MTVGMRTVLTRVAAADLSLLTHRVAALNGSGQVVVANSGSAPAISGPVGVIYNTPRSGEAVSVAIFGPAKVFAQNTVADMALVTAGTSGGVIAAASGDLVIGRVTAFANAGTFVPIWLNTPWRLIGAA